ncbi:hypothetical protein PHAMO_270242 [Magnetospirillum molischianum DSM 120]|uniref:Uncharacterized protein n=1 Tax=Magnetospirillum molischianum DSM 120 TaxID=1150626 RepID=H8FSR3_MAGML|nr:hypothetical protein PHAMO_270242 [Magnetospirillum molischianum DSM 120]
MRRYLPGRFVSGFERDQAIHLLSVLNGHDAQHGNQGDSFHINLIWNRQINISSRRLLTRS